MAKNYLFLQMARTKIKKCYFNFSALLAQSAVRCCFILHFCIKITENNNISFAPLRPWQTSLKVFQGIKYVFQKLIQIYSFSKSNTGRKFLFSSEN